MSWPKHELFDNLRDAGTKKLISRGFSVASEDEGRKSFEKGTFQIRIQHGGYDFPYVLIGLTGSKLETELSTLLELYFDWDMNIGKKHYSNGSSYDFAYQDDLLETYWSEIEKAVINSNHYQDWYSEKTAEVLAARIRFQLK
jgi:hypothetical protein